MRCLSKPDRSHFLQHLRTDAAEIPDEEITGLLDTGNWRHRLAAGWLIAADRREAFQQRIGELLLDSDLCFASQGYCLALARLATGQAAEALTAYLDRYLRRPDQHWAVGALLHIDATTGTDQAGVFTRPGGLWEAWAVGDAAAAARNAARHIDRLCDLLDGR